MRVAALADVHGNAVALEAVLAELAGAAGPDRRAATCPGPLPLETVALLEPWRERLLCVRGNWSWSSSSGSSSTPRSRVGARAARRSGADEYLSRTQAGVTVEVDGLGTTLFCHGSAAERRGVRHRRDAGRARGRVHGRRRRGVRRHRAHAHAVRPARGAAAQRAASACRTSRAGHAYWALLGPDVELAADAVRPRRRDRAAARRRACRVRADRELMTPPPHAEVIEHAERVVFAG